MIITNVHFYIVGALLFSIGIYGILARQNSMDVISSVMLIFNAAVLNFIAGFSSDGRFALQGEIWVMCTASVAACMYVLMTMVVILVIVRTKSGGKLDDMHELEG